VFDFSKLPIAPEFVDVLQEQAMLTAIQYLKKTHAGEDITKLVEGIYELSYYLVECHRNPQSMTGDPRDRFEIEVPVIETINAIANLGGQFHADMFNSKPRKGTALAEEKPKEKASDKA
jgi:hypothetical protein